MALPEASIEAIRSHGYEWHVWTIDDQPSAGRARSLGAASITTNRPGYIREALAAS